jgi:HSP20 family protein
MALIRWRDRDLEPAGTFDWLQQQINDLFDVPRFPEMQGLFDRRISPAVDVVEHPDHFTVECDLPGLEQKDIDLSIASGVLTIKGEKKGEKVNEKARGGQLPARGRPAGHRGRREGRGHLPRRRAAHRAA